MLRRCDRHLLSSKSPISAVTRNKITFPHLKDVNRLFPLAKIGVSSLLFRTSDEYLGEHTQQPTGKSALVASAKKAGASSEEEQEL